MAVTETYVDSTLTPGNITSNRPAGTYFRYMCETEADLPTANLIDGDRAFTEDSDRRWLRVGGAWVLQTNDIIAAALITTSQQDALPIGAVADGQFLKRDGANIVGAAAAGGAAWGDITGTLSDQTDLQAALDSKGTSNFSGAYADLSGKPTLGTAAATAIGDYATAAQGTTANSALQPAGNGSALTGLTKTQVGLANADNTSDANKPVSTATQTALDGKQPSGSYATGTGTANGTNTGDQTAGSLGLGNVNNTSDANKPVSTATQAALDAKQATLVSGTNIKTVNGSTLLGSGNLAVSASDPSYTPGSFTVATGTGRLVIKRMQLLTTERATVAGTARLRVA